MWRFATVVFLAFLPGCSGSRSLPAASDATAVLVGESHFISSLSSNCGFINFFIQGKRSKFFFVPPIPDTKNFTGKIYYAALSNSIRAGAEVASCTTNEFNVPTPTGYAADWFGAFDVCCVTFSFESANLSGGLKSATWVAGTNYYLYVYTENGEFVESYPIGPLQQTTLQLASPFENGLLYWQPFVLEIVHPSP